MGEKLRIGTEGGSNVIADITDLGSISNIEMGTSAYADYVKITLGAGVTPTGGSDFTTDSVLFSNSFKEADFKPRWRQHLRRRGGSRHDIQRRRGLHAGAVRHGDQLHAADRHTTQLLRVRAREADPPDEPARHRSCLLTFSLSSIHI